MSGLWTLVRRSIAGRPLRSALTVIAISLGIAAVLGVQITVDALDSEATAAQRLSAGASGLDVRVDSGSGLNAAQVRQLSLLGGVAEAAPLYEKRVVAAPAKSGITGLIVTLVGVSRGQAALRPVQVVTGRLPRAGSTSEVAIDQGLGASLTAKPGSGLHTGQRIQLITSTGPDEFVVVGMTTGTSGGPGFTRSAVFVDDAAMLGTFKLGLRTPLVALRLAPGATAANVADEVRHALGPSVTAYNPSSAAGTPLADLRPLLVLVTVLSVIVGAGVAANSVALAVLERRRDIGLLRAAGASANQVFRLFAAEATLIAACSVPIGIGAGLGLGALLDTWFAPSDLPVPAVNVSWFQVTGAVVAGLGAAIVGGLLPAIAAGRLPVLSALRLQPERRRRGAHPVQSLLSVLCLLASLVCFLGTGSAIVAAGVALFLLAVVLAMPVLAPMLAQLLARAASPIAPSAATAAGNLTRNRNRTALTGAGLSVCVAVAVGVSALTAGALSASDGWVSHLFVGDTVITSAVTQQDSVAKSLRSNPDIQSLTQLRIFSESVGGSVLGITSLDPTVFASHDGLDVLTPSRTSALGALATGATVLVPESLATAAGWQTGTQLPVQTLKGATHLTVVGVVAHSFPAGDGSETLIMGSDAARTYFGATATGFDDLLVFSDGATRNLSDAAATYGMQAVPVSDIEAAARNALQHSIGLLLALAVVSVTIALLSVVNTLVVNVRQGTRELALLRAVGLARRHALRLVLAESGLLALSAALIGVAAGCVVAFPMLRASGTPGFLPGFAFPALTAAALAAAVVLSALLSTLGPARRAVRVSVLTALRQE